MARTNGNRILKDVNGDISDHLHNHVHLTNCIHLKNHIHKSSPILGNRHLLKDLVAIQNSRSLRDPSTSPRFWQSPSVVDVLWKRGERDVLVNGRRPVGLGYREECRRISGTSPAVSNQSISKAAESELRRHGEATGMRERGASHERRVRREESSRNNNHVQERYVLVKSAKNKGLYRQERSVETLADQVEDITARSDDAAFSCNHDRKHVDMDKITEVKGKVRGHGNNMKTEKRRRFRSARRNRPSISTQAAETQPEMSIASNSYAECRDPLQYRMGDEVQEYDDQNIAGVSSNKCSIPWNWSRIHHRGKSSVDLAGGKSESHLKKNGTLSQGRGISDMALMSEQSSSSTMTEREALPLLVDDPFLHDYSGELGIFVDNLLRQETDSSEGRAREQRTLQRQHTDRHKSLTQKYIPTTFRDLVGQNLVVQALSNAITKRKVGLLYVFYGPHGTGKTTCARIFAKALNCQSLKSTKPCGFCDSCIEHATGKSRNVREIGPVSEIDLESVIELLHDMIASNHRTQYGVFIFDDCDTLSSDCWSVILKVIDRAPRHVIFVLVCSSLDVLPHVITSRCQKFFFSKLKDADILYTLQWIATKEDLEIDKDALKLIASSSNGSLRDAEMTLEQLSLLGQKISLCLVQELIGLISDEKLVDLLDSALSADTINTVKNLRDITQSGIEPLTLMSQLATVITDILAGSYNSTRQGPKMKFFEFQALSKENMEKLRQALKTLSEAEKQLRVSNNKMTWLTAALLQLVPDQQYMLPRPSADSNLGHSPVALNNTVSRLRHGKNNAEMRASQDGSSGDVIIDDKSKVIEKDVGQMNKRIEEVWLEVLEKISIKSLKEFMHQEGKLISLSYGAAPTARLLFNSQLTKSNVEKFRSHILEAFELVLRSPVTIEIRDNSSCEVNRSEIVDVEASPSKYKCSNCNNISIDSNRQNTAGAVMSRQGTFSTTARFSGQRESSERSHSLSLVRGKVSLAHMIHHAEGCSQHIGWSKRKPVSIAEKVEQDNLRLESRSRRLFCWNPPRLTRRTKFSGMKIRTRKTQAVLKFVSCGRCIYSRSSSRMSPTQ
ncbi:hypothetical protein ACS0TY_032294 [Phlomoides rotata]